MKLKVKDQLSGSKLKWNTCVHLAAAAVFLFSSCRKENNLFSSDRDDSRVVFTSSIAGLPQTRAQGTQWDSSDSIGIFMYRSGEELSDASVIDGARNKRYWTTSTSGNFSPKTPGDVVEFPTSDKVDFIAYYPYTPGNTLAPTHSISSQENQPALDFMVAKNATGRSVGNGPVALSFGRQMSKIELRVKGTDLTSLKAAFYDLPTTGTFDFNSAAFTVGSQSSNVEAHIHQLSATEAIVQWTIFPGALRVENKIVFSTASGRSYTWNITSETTFAKGHRYQYEVTLGGNGQVTPTPTASYMELPVITETATLKYSLKMTNNTRRNYSILYDTENMYAQWVAYPLSGDYLGSVSRTDRWAYDPDFATNLQANLRSGYPDNGSLLIDRGHQLPSGDRTAIQAENIATFYYTNMTPQARTLNQQVWQRLEDKIRSWTNQSGVDTMYVVTGGMPSTATDTRIDYVEDNSGKNVGKPKYYYKVLAMKRGDTYHTIGFRFNNVAHASNVNYMNYTKTVAEIEAETGFTFFPALSKDVKSKIDNSVWR